MLGLHRSRRESPAIPREMFRDFRDNGPGRFRNTEVRASRFGRRDRQESLGAEELDTDLVFTVDSDFLVYRIRGRKSFRVVPESS